jgi:DHA1 family inner membrane transport protein
LNDRRRSLLALSLYHGLNDGSIAIFTSALPVMRIALNLDLAEIGAILSVGLVATFVLQFAFGYASDRGMTKLCVIVGFVGIVLGDLFIALSASIPQLLFAYVFLRSAAGAYHPAGFAYFSRAYESKRVEVFGMQGAIGDGCIVLATASTGFLAEAYGWKSPFIVWGVIGAVQLGFFLWVVRRLPETPKDDTTLKAQPSPGRRKFPVLWMAILLGASSIMGAVFSVFSAYMPLYFNLSKGLSPGVSTLMTSLWILVGVFAGITVRWFIKPFGTESRALVAYFAIQATMFSASALLSLISQGAWVYLLYLVLTLSGIPAFLCFPFINSLIGAATSRGSTGFAYAVVLGMNVMAGSISSYALGLICNAYGIEAILPFTATLTITGSALAILLTRLKTSP